MKRDKENTSLMRFLLCALACVLTLAPTTQASLLCSASLDRIDHGSAASLDDITAGFFCAAIYVTDWTDTGPQMIFQKNGVNYTLWVDGFDGSLFFQIGRATTSLEIIASPSQLGSHWVVNNWLTACVVWDAAGADTAQHFYTGSPSVSLVEPGTYTLRRSGSGTVTSNAANNLTVGGGASANQHLKGRVAWAMLGNSVKTLAQLESLRSRPFRYDTSVVLFTQYGWAGTGTQPDLSGNVNNGTVTGSSVAPHAPIARWP